MTKQDQPRQTSRAEQYKELKEQLTLSQKELGKALQENEKARSFVSRISDVLGLGGDRTDSAKKRRESVKELEQKINILETVTHSLSSQIKKLLNQMSPEEKEAAGLHDEETRILKIQEIPELQAAPESREHELIPFPSEVLHPGSDSEKIATSEQENAGIYLALGTGAGGVENKYSKEGRNSEDFAGLFCSSDGTRFGTAAFDGMGGYGGGEIVTKKGAEIMQELLQDEELSQKSLKEKVAEMSRRLKEFFKGKSEVSDSDGFTLAAVECNVDKRTIELLRVGDAGFLILKRKDSGAYEESIEAQKKVPPEQSHVQDAIDSGDTDMIQLAVNRFRNQTKGAIRAGEDKGELQDTAILTQEDVSEGDLIFSYSDGIGDNITTREMIDIANEKKSDGSAKTIAEIRDDIIAEVLGRSKATAQAGAKFMADFGPHSEKKRSTRDNVTFNVMQISNEFFLKSKKRKRLPEESTASSGAQPPTNEPVDDPETYVRILEKPDFTNFPGSSSLTKEPIVITQDIGELVGANLSPDVLGQSSGSSGSEASPATEEPTMLMQNVPDFHTISPEGVEPAESDALHPRGDTLDETKEYSVEEVNELLKKDTFAVLEKLQNVLPKDWGDFVEGCKQEVVSSNAELKELNRLVTELLAHDNYFKEKLNGGSESGYDAVLEKLNEYINKVA